MSYSFDGVNDYMESGSVSDESVMTAVVWLKTAQTNSSTTSFLGMGGAFAHYNHVERYQSRIFCASRAGGSTAFSSGLGNYSANTWTFVGGRFNGTANRQSILGTLIGTAGTTTVDPAVSQVTLGTRADVGGGNWFSGLLAHAAIFDYAVSDTDLDALAGGANPLSLSVQPIAYYPLTDSGDTANYGTGGTSYDLTNVGATHSTDNPTVDPPPSAGGIHKRWSGTEWVSTVFKHGASWDVVTLKKLP